MHVTDALVRQVAKLARIELSDAEVAAMVPQLDRILGHVEAVGSVDAGAHDAGSHDTGALDPVPSATLRPDVEAPSLDRARDVMRNAPEKDTMGVFFLVPKVLED
ncbi:MAG: Asp-tRNA(Asn)/Glu-tRNA(Gln) amidotransferase subunit GatC [Planctomycetota bacterium]